MTAPGPSGTATRAVLGRGSVYTLATAGPALVTVLIIPAVTRLLSKEQYDLVAVSLVVVQVGYILVALGMGMSITRQYILDRAGAAGARGLVAQGAGLASVAAGLLAATAAWWTPAVLGREPSSALLLAMAACLGGAWMVLAQAYLRGADRPGAFVVLAALAGLLGPVLGLGALLATDRSATAFLAGIAAGYLAAGVLGLCLVLVDGALDASRSGLARALRIGLPTVPHQVSLYLALAGLVVVADRMLDDGGGANVALTIGAGATVITAGLNNAWAPLVYQTAPAERRRVLDETARAIAAVTVVVAGVVALLGPWLLQIAAPASYDRAHLVPALALASAAAVPSVAYLASGHLVFASARTGWLAATTPFAVAGGLATAYLSSSRWGLGGIGAGYLATYVLLVAATTAVQRAVSPTPWWPPFLPVVTLAWIAATALGAWLPSDTVGASLRVAAAAALVVGLAVAAARAQPRAIGSAARGSTAGPSGVGR